MNSETYITENFLVRCEFDDECDSCKSPSGGSWAKIHQVPEDVAETEFYICGGCISDAAQKEVKP